MSPADGNVAGHVPVLLTETLDALAIESGKIYVDLTLDGGGHATEILERSAPDGRLIGFDMDAGMIENGRKRFQPYGERVTLVHDNFRNLSQCLKERGVGPVDGILADLGFSSVQLDAARGLSFRESGPLDMRLDPGLPDSAGDLIERLDWRELAKILSDYGEERNAGRIARAVKAKSEAGRLQSTGELADTISAAIPKRFHPKKIHPATRSFQALRIAVNRELESLERMLPQALEALNPGGRLAVIAYHSLEDRLVRRAFREWEKDCVCPPGFPVCVCDKKRQARSLTRKPILPGEAEIESNPRSRSARLRVAERV